MNRTQPAFAVLGNAGCKRVEFFQQALQALGLPPALLITYLDLLTGRVDCAQALPREAWLRIESPGRDFEVERQLLAWGAELDDPEAPDALRLSRAAALALPFDKGRLQFMRQQFLGFRQVLGRVQQALNVRRDVRCLNPCEHILAMCDKPRCHARLADAGVSVPQALPKVNSYEQLIQHMLRTRIWRVFLKPSHGSSAAGVMAFELRPRPGGAGPLQQAYTTVELVRADGSVRFYNSRKIRKYTAPEDLSLIVDMLAREGIHVEAWWPKAQLAGLNFDLRVVVICGQAQHTVARLSRSPMTNLHLLNERAEATAVRERMGAEAWSAAMSTCERAAAVFCGSLHAGIDLAISPSFRSHAVLEVNAFGDLLPGCKHAGRDTYAAELAGLIHDERLAVR